MSLSRRSVVAGCALSAIAGTAGRAHGPAHHAGSDFASSMHQSMAAMMGGMDRPMSGDPDRDFLAMMIPHHQGAVEMARLVLVHGRDPLTRQLADEIIASQQAEIGSMRARLRLLEAGSAVDEFPALSGTRGG